MNNAKKTSKTGKVAEVRELLSGIGKHFRDPTQTITVGGTSMTVQQASSKLQTLVDLRNAVVGAQNTAKAKVAAERDQLPALTDFVAAFVVFLRSTFGAAAEPLGDFGLLPPRARTPMTAEQKAVAAAKARATREKRGTQGPKAKKAVHGNVTATLVVTPAPAPAAAPAPAPAPGAAAGTPQQR
jgi:hypothetical protein